MKKFLKTGKKTLSVFMAVLMAFTALVFVAPEMASAVDAGKYYVRVTCHNDDAKNAKGSYTAPWQDKNGGYSVDGNYGSAKSTNGRTSYNSGGGYTIFYKNSAGTETWTTSSVVDIESFYYKDAGNEGKTTTFTTAVDGFPTKIQYYNCESDGFSMYEATWYIEEIEVANNKNMTGATTIWSGQYGATSHTFARVGYIYPNDSTGETEMTMPKGGWSSSKKTTNSGYESKWINPVPSKIDWTSASEANLTISKGSDTVNRAFKFNILDQYGVVMSTNALKAAKAEPTVSVTATNFGTDGVVSTGTGANLYYTNSNSTDNYTATVSAKPALKSLEQGINFYKVTVNVSVPGTGISESKTFTIYDPKYTVYFNENGGNTLAPASTQVYYGESLNSQAKLDGTSNYPTGGTYAGHSWLGLFDDRTAGNPMDPDAAVTASRIYYAHWDENTYVVVFLDKNGKCVDIQYVGYGEEVNDTDAKAEIDKEKYPTSDKHFTFKEWDQDISKVSSNMIVNAVYDEGTHTFDAGTPVAANCQHGAGTEYTCTVCGYKKVNETSSVKGSHTLTGLIQDVAPTCTETGKGHKECTVCGEIVEADIEIPALDHSYKIEEKTPATCAKEGERALTCTRCGESHTEAIPKTQHNYVKVNHVPATCNSSAYDVMECSVCKDSYKLYLGAASNEHTWTESYDKTTGVLTLTCSVCDTVKTVDIGANLENFVSATVTKDPTCKEDGVVTVTAGDDTFTVTIGKDKIPHKYETKVTDATCTDDGKIVNVCTVCDYRDEANAKVIAKLGHDLKEKITTPATCTATGVKTISCKRDGCNYSTTEVIPATGHKTSEVVVDCTSGGTIKCVYCNEELGTIPAKDHNYTGEVREVPATCDKNGIRYTKCATCGAEKAELTAKKDHTYGAWEVMVPAKCGAQGVEKRTCQCGAYEVRTIAALKHDITTTETFATCTEAGVKVDKCQRVGCDYQNTVVTQPTGHKLDSGVVHDSTCTTGKYTVYTCTNTDKNTGEKCDYQSFEIAAGEDGEALGHDFSVVKSTVAATCEQDGSQVMECSRCGETETVVLPKLGHNFTAKETVPATCTTSAYTVMACDHDGCNKTYKEYTGDPNGHTWGNWVVTKASTNDEAGEMERTCTVSGCNSKEIAQIPAGGHSFEGAVGEVITAATCHSKGVTRYTCTAHKDCGVSIDVETAKTPHTLRTSITYPKCERIDNGDGTYKDVFTPGEIKVYCSNDGCGYVDETATIVLPIDDHKWGAFQTMTDATCAKPGKSVRYCKNCGAADYKEIPVTKEHHFIPTVVAPTCEERGFTTYACKGCGLTYRDDFTDALGHDYDEGTPVEATCTTPGGILYTCKRVFQSEKIVDGEKVYVDVPCGHTKFVEDASKPATGHNMSDWRFVEHPHDENAYAKERICMNAGCTYSEYETGAGEDHEIEGVNAYYKVTFYNEWVTDTYDELKDHRLYSNPNDEAVYTKLAKTYKTVELASIYVLKNTEAVYPNKVSPKREKDADWGGYSFEGWTKTKGVGAFGKDATVTPDDLSKITANTDLYALFKCRDVYYKVRFYNPNGKPLTKETVILHGHSAEWPESFGTPTMPDNITWKYTFSHWAYDYTKIYDDVAIEAVYDATAKVYHLEYYDENGNLLATEDVNNGQKLAKVPTIEPTQKEDKKYVYIFTGTWTLENGAPISTEHFAVPAGSNEGDTIKVYARYSKRQKVYPVKLHIVDPYDASAPLEGVSVQVMDSKGQLVATGETDANGDVSFSLYYDQFTFSASRGNYYFNGIMSFDDGVAGNAIHKVIPDNIYMGTIQLAVKENPDDGKKCGCICHTFLSGIWITFMNILYKVFGVKHVCCYDMYAVHGDKLTYGRS